ncbi:MFS transporter [Actinomadura pelletieri DSM 43383]|uniref:MFS transporter n=1 Tax=Actinomadura pelletieri DSM 43383 TaxID=1120940 RepID=A0A495QYE9_9ACTN|nr:MFS transporter [Actinomadura pelletieri]RKS79229.1 MFS transporter [Actinomadura pelletieri DSM 43383]
MSTSPARTGGRAWASLFVLCGAVFLEGIDVAMLNIALPSIRTDLGLSTGMLSGVISAYVLGYGGFMLLGGRAADLLGRRRVFLFWLVVFLVFSGLGGFATEGWMLLLARFVTGVASAFMMPAGLALITATFPAGPARTRALGFYAGTGAGGFTLGLVAGGLLTSIGWRWVFFAPVIVAALLLAAAIPLIKEPESADEPGPATSGGFDLVGAFTVTGAMLLLAYGVVRLERPGHGVALTASALLGGLLLLAVFVAVERRAANPLLRFGILRSAPLVRTNLSAALFLGAFAGFQFLMTIYLQELRGWTTWQTGLAMLVLGIDTVLAPTLTPRLVERFGNLRVLFGGLALAAVGYGLFLPLGLDWAYTTMLPIMVVLGMAFTFAYGPLTMAATDGVAEREHGLAGGLFYTAIQFGTALGLSTATAVQVAALGGDGSPAAGLDAIRTALIVPFAAAALAALITAFGLRARAARPVETVRDPVVPAEPVDVG